MTLQALTHVHATHDIRRSGRHHVKQGVHGIVVDTHPGWSGDSYTVEFTSNGERNQEPHFTLVGLTDGDLEPD